MALFGKRDDKTIEAGAPATETPAPAPRETTTTAKTSSAAAREGTDDVANIGKSITIKGDLTGNEDLAIEGRVDGKVELPSNQLTVGANGVVQAEVNAKSVIVIGHVSGNVHGTERVEIQATGIVDGDVSAPRLVVAEGAVINGSIQMSKKPASAGSATPPAPGGEEVRKTA